MQREAVLLLRLDGDGQSEAEHGYVQLDHAVNSPDCARRRAEHYPRAKPVASQAGWHRLRVQIFRAASVSASIQASVAPRRIGFSLKLSASASAPRI